MLHRVAVIPMVLIGAMGLLKLLDLPEFSAAVHTWTMVPRALHPIVSVLVPIAEVTVASCWMVGIRRVRCEVFALGLLLVFSCVYAIQWVASGPPTCGCFGVMARHFHEIEQARVVLARNFILAGLLGASLWAPKSDRKQKVQLRGPHSPACRGFTLVESLLVVLLIGVLVGLFSPSLLRVRDSAKEIKSVFNLRSHATVLSMYASDFGDSFPRLTEAGATYNIIRCESAGLALEIHYFEAYLYWNISLADQYYDGAWNSSAFRTPWDPAGGGLATSYHTACSFVADPSYFNRMSRKPPPSQLRTVRFSEVIFPNMKGVLTAYTPWVTRRDVSSHVPTFQAATVDGRAASFLSKDTLPQYPTADGPYPAYGGHDYVLTPMTHTIGMSDLCLPSPTGLIWRG